MPAHRAERELRAWRDGELPLHRRLLLAWHLRRCDRCRASLTRIDGERHLLSCLLASREPPTDIDEAWRRFQVLSGRSGGRALSSRTIVGAVGFAVIAILAAGFWPRSGDLASEVDWLLHPTPVKAKESSISDARFVERLLRLEAAGQVRILQDTCCEDRDGEGPADDGLAIVRVSDRPATLAVLYEDLDGSRALTTGDLIRLVSRMADADARTIPASPRLIESRVASHLIADRF